TVRRRGPIRFLMRGSIVRGCEMKVVPSFRRRGREARSLLVAACASLALAADLALAGSFSISATTVGTIDSTAWMGNSSSPYGRAMNGNSFETQTITTYN